MKSLILVLFSIFGLAAYAETETPICSLSVDDKTEKSTTYGPRLGRCEGVYTQKVSSRIALRVIGYQVNRFPDVIDDKSFPDAISLSIAGGTEMLQPQLVLASLRPSDYYQMDTRLLDDGRFSWPTDVLRNLSNPPFGRDLAVLSCDGPCTDSFSPPRLHPVLIDGLPKDWSRTAVRLIVTSDVDLETLHVVVKSQETGEILTDYMTRSGFIPARKGTHVRFANSWEGMADLFIEARTHDARRSTFEAVLWPPRQN